MSEEKRNRAGGETSFSSGAMLRGTNDECERHNVDNKNNNIEGAGAREKKGGEKITLRITF